MPAGYEFDPHTLRAVLTDEAAFREANAGDPGLEALIALYSGRAADAEAMFAELCAADPGKIRWRALLADARSVLGHHHASERAYRELITESVNDAQRATLVQHLGKVLFDAGRIAEAAACFAEALSARRALGVPEDQLASSELALAVAREACRGGQPEPGVGIEPTTS